MSLFALAEYWRKDLPGDEYDPRHLTASTDTLFLASYSGKLKVLLPAPSPALDLILEKQLVEPILQLEWWRGALHVLFLKGLSKMVMEGDTLRQVSALTLGEPAYQMCGQENYIVVQHLGPRISIIERNAIVAVVEVGFLLYPQPKPVFIGDRLWLTSATYSLKGFKVSTLTTRKSMDAKPDSEFQLGEQPVFYKAADAQLWVLTSYELLLLQGSGRCRRKRFQFEAVSGLLIFNVKNEPVMLVGTSHNSILVYKDFVLVWAATTAFRPSSLQIITVNGVRGFITVFGENQLAVACLGTRAKQPPLPQQTFQQDMLQVQKEYKRVLKLSQQGYVDQPTDSPLEVTLKAGVVSQAEQFIQHEDGLLCNERGKVLACVLTLTLKATAKVGNVCVALTGPANVLFSQQTISFTSLEGTKTAKIQAYVNRLMFPSTINVRAETSYAVGSDFKLCSAEVDLPTSLFMKGCEMKKEAQFKVVLVGSSDLGSVHQMFGDVLGKTLPPPGNTYSFELSNGVATSLVLAKSSFKVRVQSDYYEGLYFLMREVARRAKTPFSMDVVPLQDYFQLLEQCLALQERQRVLSKELQQACANFLVVERRLMGRFKERAAQESNSLGLLLEEAYGMILSRSKEAGKVGQEWQVMAARTRVAALTVELMVMLKAGSGLNQDVLRMVLEPGEEGWLQRVNKLGDFLTGVLGVCSVDRLKKVQMLAIKRTLEGASLP